MCHLNGESRHQSRLLQDTLDDAESAMEERQSNRLCSTEAGAKLMCSGLAGIVPGYDIQTAVDAYSGLNTSLEAEALPPATIVAPKQHGAYIFALIAI